MERKPVYHECSECGFLYCGVQWDGEPWHCPECDHENTHDTTAYPRQDEIAEIMSDYNYRGSPWHY
jgi:hypothetical protein